MATDILASLSPVDVAAWYRRLALSINAKFNNDSLAAQLLLHWLDGQGKLKVFKAKYVKDLTEVKDFQRNEARQIFLSHKALPGTGFFGKKAGIVPRIKKAPGYEKEPGVANGGPFPMHFEGNCEVGIGVQLSASLGRKVDPQELDVLYALHGFTMICNVVAQVSPCPEPGRFNVVFTSWKSKTRDDYHWNPDKHITVPNPDFNSRNAAAVAPTQKEVVVFHKNAKRVEDAGLAAPFVDESEEWEEQDRTIVGPAVVQV